MYGETALSQIRAAWMACSRSLPTGALRQNLCCSKRQAERRRCDARRRACSLCRFSWDEAMQSQLPKRNSCQVRSPSTSAAPGGLSLDIHADGSLAPSRAPHPPNRGCRAAGEGRAQRASQCCPPAALVKIPCCDTCDPFSLLVVGGVRPSNQPPNKALPFFW